jgi:hypothetical protein
MLSDLKAQIAGLNVFQLQEIQRTVNARMAEFGIERTSPGLAPTPGAFKRGDLIEFYSSKKHRTVRLVVDRINPKTLGGHEQETPSMMWRVPPSMCRLVGADKPAPLIADGRVGLPASDLPERTSSHIPSAGGGAW